MKSLHKPALWVCLTLLVVAGLKYLPTYLVLQRQLDLQERALDLKEEAFLHQQATPTVSLPAPAPSRHYQLL